MRSAEEPTGVLLRPCSCGRGGTLQKRTPPLCFTLAGMALVEAHAAVLLCSGWRGGAVQMLEHGCTWRYRSILQEYAGYIGTVQRRGIYGYDITRVQRV